MDYQVWTKPEFEGWQKVDCGDKPAAMREIDKAVRAGKHPLLTVAIPYKLDIIVEEDKAGVSLQTEEEPAPSEESSKEVPGHEADQSEAKPNQST